MGSNGIWMVSRWVCRTRVFVGDWDGYDYMAALATIWAGNLQVSAPFVVRQFFR